jgi:hypothetical protein
MRLDSLFFTFESPNDIQLLTLLLPSLKSVTEFVASGFSADEASLHFLFTKLDRLEILDISHCNPVFCQALKLAKGESVSVCPHLVDLSVATIGYEQLLDLVKSRIPPAVKIELLTLQDRPPLLSDFVIVDEIESMVTDFNYDPGRWPYFDPSWIAPLGRSNSWRDSIM